ncbi:uncharacterized protein LOC126817954 [Patella vulgata]|uniref:uncharacterized protein LOC126817954 n=1 Tax=Patella vulgata TaxID=6465 RepID=UPI0024A89724|nr:uncharacterized protein LOC126817954 [Patella vulgata]XP_050401095.2 uncharacterized protein LOC126817954 [Patella vulgata]
MPSAKKRNSYTAAFKLEVVNYAEENDGNMAAHRMYGVSEKCVRDWRKAKEALRQTKKTKKANRGCKARWGDLEDKLEEYVLSQRAANKGLNTGKLRLKAQEIATDLGVEDFTGNPSWCFRFMRRKGLRNDSDNQLYMYKKAFEKFSSEIITKKIINDNEILYMSKLLAVFKSYVDKVEDLDAFDYRSSNLKSRLRVKFPQLEFCQLTYDLKSEIVFVEDTYPSESSPTESTETESSTSEFVSSYENSWETKSSSSESLPFCENSRETIETKSSSSESLPFCASSTKSNPLDNDLQYLLYTSAITLRNEFPKTTVYNGARPPILSNDCESSVYNGTRSRLSSVDCKSTVYNGALPPLLSDDCKSTVYNGTRPPLSSDDCKSLIPIPLYNTIAWIVGGSDEQTLDAYVKVEDSVNLKLLSILRDLVQLHSKHKGNTLQNHQNCGPFNLTWL